jgi:hypothetical protein
VARSMKPMGGTSGRRVVGDVEHPGDRRDPGLDLPDHPLLQGNVGHAAALAAPFQADISGIVL